MSWSLRVRRNTTIDWAEKESVRAKLRLVVKRVLRRHGYPPDKQENATKTVLEQAELLSARWGTEPTEDADDLGDESLVTGVETEAHAERQVADQRERYTPPGLGIRP